MPVRKIEKSSEMCTKNIKLITLSLEDYYLKVEQNLLAKVKDIILLQEKIFNYSLISYNILKLRTISYHHTDEYISQIILKRK